MAPQGCQWPTEDSSLRLLSDPFTFATWNIERGLKLERIEHELATALHADVLVLQEVDRFARRTGFRDIAADLAQATRMHQAFGVEFIELAQGTADRDAIHGNLTLSRAALGHSRTLRFQAQPHDWGKLRLKLPWLQPRSGGRIALVSEIPCSSGRLIVYNAHLESRADENGRLRQVRELLHDLANTYDPAAPVIVSGDLNTKAGSRSPVVSALLNCGFEDVFPPHTAPETTKPGQKRRLDWIFVRGMSVLSAAVHPVKISDHYPVVAQLRFSR
jgi:endonuclease/exonuclease/phosphatase family metal-dependent hydrolase